MDYFNVKKVEAEQPSREQFSFSFLFFSFLFPSCNSWRKWEKSKNYKLFGVVDGALFSSDNFFSRVNSPTLCADAVTAIDVEMVGCATF